MVVWESQVKVVRAWPPASVVRRCERERLEIVFSQMSVDKGQLKRRCVRLV